MSSGNGRNHDECCDAPLAARRGHDDRMASRGRTLSYQPATLDNRRTMRGATSRCGGEPDCLRMRRRFKWPRPSSQDVSRSRRHPRQKPYQDSLPALPIRQPDDPLVPRASARRGCAGTRYPLRAGRHRAGHGRDVVPCSCHRQFSIDRSCHDPVSPTASSSKHERARSFISGSIKPRRRDDRVSSFQVSAPRDATNDGTVLLFDFSRIVLLAGARSHHLHAFSRGLVTTMPLMNIPSSKFVARKARRGSFRAFIIAPTTRRLGASSTKCAQAG